MNLPARCLLAVVLVAPLGACGDSFLPPARRENREEVIKLFAVDGTPLEAPSALQLVDISAITRAAAPTGVPVRTDRTASFDAVFNIVDGAPLLFPTGALGMSELSGMQPVDRAFEDIDEAPLEDYVVDAPISAAPGTVLVIQSRPISCFGASLFIYAKVEITTVDLVSRSVSFDMLMNPNCGFRQLRPGIPSR